MYIRSSRKATLIIGMFEQIQKNKNNNKEEENEKTRKKLVIEIKDAEKNKNPLTEEEVKRLISLIKQFHITAYNSKTF